MPEHLGEQAPWPFVARRDAQRTRSACAGAMLVGVGLIGGWWLASWAAPRIAEVVAGWLV